MAGRRTWQRETTRQSAANIAAAGGHVPCHLLVRQSYGGFLSSSPCLAVLAKARRTSAVIGGDGDLAAAGEESMEYFHLLIALPAHGVSDTDLSRPNRILRSMNATAPVSLVRTIPAYPKRESDASTGPVGAGSLAL